MIQHSDIKLIEKLNDLSLFSNAQFDHVRFFFPPMTSPLLLEYSMYFAFYF